jgi:hypothetical protein
MSQGIVTRLGSYRAVLHFGRLLILREQLVTLYCRIVGYDRVYLSREIPTNFCSTKAQKFGQ